MKSGHEPPSLYRYRFGTAAFDEARFELAVAGRAVEVQRLPLEILALLLAHAGEVVTKEELLETIWQGRPTVENVIHSAIRKLREALGEDNAGFVATVPRVGYRFTGQVERVAVGRELATAIDLHAGDPVPGRTNFVLQALLPAAGTSEVWVARHARTGERRVYKFARSGEQLGFLKREATLFRVLHQSLGARADFVRVLDWNFEAPPFFLECEYGGESLGAWAAAQPGLAALDLQQRIDLFLQIADAVAAAHSVGVLHKDLKPANVLVAQLPEGRRVRLTDFGSGGLVGAGRIEALGITRLGLTHTVDVAADSGSGTPMYLAPELIGGQSPTVQSDLYALGLILWQLVVGDPKRPMAPGWEADVPDALLREDIAAATDGNPARRLASVAELAERLRHRDERAGERTRLAAADQRARLAERNLQRARARRPWLIAAIVALSVGLAGAAVLYLRLRATESDVQRQYALARTLNEFFSRNYIALANPLASGRKDVTVAETTRKAAADIDESFKDAEPAVRGALHAAMQDAFFGLSQYDASVDEGGKSLLALEAVQPRDTARLVDVRLRMAQALENRSRFDEAAAQVTAIERLLAVPGIATPVRRAQYLMAMAGLELEKLDTSQALTHYADAWQLVAHDAEASADLRDEVHFEYVDALRMAGQFDNADREVVELLKVRTARFGTEHPQTCFTEAERASILSNLDAHREEAATLINAAADCMEKTLGPDAARTGSTHWVQADMLFRLQRFDEAAAAYTAVARTFTAVSGANSARTISALSNVGRSYLYGGHLEQARQSLQATLQVARTALGWEAPATEGLRYQLADCDMSLHDYADVARLLDGLDADTLRDAEVEDDWEGRLAYQRGRLALHVGDRGRAREQLQRAVEIIGAKNPDGNRISVAMARQLLQQAGS